MSYVLAIEPGPAQAQVLLNAIGAVTSARVDIVRSVEAAIAAIDEDVPRAVLVNPLMSPRDEEQLMDRLRQLPTEITPRVLITPVLAVPDQAEEAAASGPKLFARFRKQAAPTRSLNEPSAFAGQLSQYLGDPTGPAAERRGARRIESGLDAAKLVVDGAAVDIIDLSLVGAQVRSSVPLPMGANVRLLISREADTEPLECEAAVVWVAEDPRPDGSARYRAGMRFRKIDYQMLGRLYLGERMLSVRPQP